MKWNIFCFPMIQDITKSKKGYEKCHHGQYTAKCPKKSPGPYDQLGLHQEESFLHLYGL